jgi:hypothetical protein
MQNDQVFYNKEWKEIKRTHCDIFTRVMWYYRPVNYFNTWKKAEFYSRTYFAEWKTMNSEFIKNNSCPDCCR